MTDDILFSSISELTKLIKRKKISPLRLTETLIKRIQKFNGRLSAFIPESVVSALARAAQIEREISADLNRGTLHGIPYCAQDIFSIKSQSARLGTKGNLFSPERQSTLITELENSGSILLGNCTMPEFGTDSSQTNSLNLSKNPWDPKRTLNGVASGISSAVAAGLATFGIGMDSCESLLTPASECGLTGMIPSFGRVSRFGAFTSSWSLDRIGIVGRSASDVSILINAMNGKDSDDPATLDLRLKVSLSKPQEKCASLRIATIERVSEVIEDQECWTLYDEAVRTLISLGLNISPTTIPKHLYKNVADVIKEAEHSASCEEFVRNGQLEFVQSVEARSRILAGLLIPAPDYLRCQRLRGVINRSIDTLFGQFDIVLLPSVNNCGPLGVSLVSEVKGGRTYVDSIERLSGLPAMTIPCGFSSSKLPIGLKIVGRRFADAEVIQLAHLYQTITNWHTKRPKL